MEWEGDEMDDLDMDVDLSGLKPDVKEEIRQIFINNAEQFFGKPIKKIHVTFLEETEKTEYYLIVTETSKYGKKSKLLQVYYRSKQSGKISHTQKVIRFPEELADEISTQLID